MERHLDALYTSDERGRLLRRREPNGESAPRFHLGRTRLGNLWRFRSDLATTAVRDLARLAGREAPLPPDFSPPERTEAMRRVLSVHAPIEHTWCGPAFAFPESVPVPAGAGEVVVLREGALELLGEEFARLRREIPWREPCIAIVEDGRAVCVCHAARRAPDGTIEAGIETLEGHRGRGLATRAAAAWAGAVRTAGGEPCYSTSWDNRASRRVAEKLGLRLYGEDLHWT